MKRIGRTIAKHWKRLNFSRISAFQVGERTMQALLTAARRMGLLVAILNLALSTPAWSATESADISGTWTLMDYKPTRVPARQRIPQTIEGTTPPLQPWAEKLYEQRLAASDRGQPFFPASASCLPNGIPLTMMADAAYPFQILQTPGQVTMLFTVWNIYRIIYLNQNHHKDVDDGYMGDSVGHWEGDTLVVDTIGLNDKTTLDMSGMPHSDSLHVIERIRRVDDKTLENLITVDDAKTFTRPWTTRMRYQSSKELMREYFCENNKVAPPSDQRPASSH